MVFLDTSISVDHHIRTNNNMANPVDPCSNPNHLNNNNFRNKAMKRTPSGSSLAACCREDSKLSALVDFVLLVAVTAACGFLFYPYAAVIAQRTAEIGEEVIDVVGAEIVRAPTIVFACLGVSVFLAAIALVAIAVCTDEGRCGRADCRGMRDAAEFDIQLETEETVRKSRSGAVKKGLFEVQRREEHRELEAELRKVAPANGRAVPVFRSRCGCSIGRMEVMGPRKHGKVKK